MFIKLPVTIYDKFNLYHTDMYINIDEIAYIEPNIEDLTILHTKHIDQKFYVDLGFDKLAKILNEN